MTFHQTPIASQSGAVSRAEVEALLERFPDVAEEEIRQIATFLRHGSSLDVGMLSSNTPAWEKVERLQAERPDLFRTSAKGWMIFAIVAFASVGILWSLWAIAPK